MVPMAPRIPAPSITAKSGKSLMTVVTIDIPPEARAPNALTTCSTNTAATATAMNGTTGRNAGLIQATAEAVAMASAALADQLLHQNDQVTRKATVGPKACSRCI